MQRTTPGAKEVTHERIVEAAARAIRRSGYNGTSVALGSEMPRQAPEVRRAATRRIKEMIDVVVRNLPSSAPVCHAGAIVVVGSIVFRRNEPCGSCLSPAPEATSTQWRP